MKMLNPISALLLSSVLVACGGSSSSGGGNSSQAASSSSAPSSASTVSSASSSSTPNNDQTAYCEKINTVQGFASMGNGTTGGEDVGSGNNVVSVTTGTQLLQVVAYNHSTYGSKPLIVYVDDLITWENAGRPSNGIRIQRSDVSIIGRGEHAGFEGVGIEVRARNSSGAGNIIIRNLEMRLVPQANGSGDIISLDGRSGPVRNIWIDHNELYNNLVTEGCTTENCHKDYYDELVSGRSDVGNVTISYNYLHDSWKTSLWGSNDNLGPEAFDRTVTFHHNHWANVNSRLPLYRRGELHVFNNYYTDVTGTAVNVRMGAVARVEGNVFERVRAPILSQDSIEVGHWTVSNNTFNEVTSASGGCPGTTNDKPACQGAHTYSTTTEDYYPPYWESLASIMLPAEEVKDYVLAQAGVGKIDECLGLD